MAYSIFLFAVFIVLQCVSIKCRMLDHSDPPEHFAIQHITWQLAQNAPRGEVSAEVEVSDHDLYEFRWYQQEPGMSGDSVWIPITPNTHQQLHIQRYWSHGRAYISGHMTIFHVPPVTALHLLLEVATVNHGPILKYHLVAPVSPHYHAVRQSIKPEAMQPISYPDAYQQQDRDRLPVFVFDTKSSINPVTIFKGHVADDRNNIYDNFVEVDYYEFKVDSKVSESPFPVMRIEFSPALVDQATAYRIVITSGEQTMIYQLMIEVEGQQEFFKDTHMSLESCSGISGVDDGTDDVTVFHLSTYGPDCIRCTVASPKDNIVMQITSGGMPVGSGGSHSVFWYRVGSDMAVAYFLLQETTYSYMYQTYSYAGRYYCVAMSHRGVIQERRFEIEFE